jgi:hypothetical protein
MIRLAERGIHVEAEPWTPRVVLIRKRTQMLSLCFLRCLLFNPTVGNWLAMPFSTEANEGNEEDLNFEWGLSTAGKGRGKQWKRLTIAHCFAP